METLRSVLGVVLGCLIGAATGMGVVTWLFGGDIEGGVGPWLVGILVFAAAQILAGFLAATIAGRRRLLHAGIVAGLFALVRLVEVLKGSAVEPTWYRIMVLLVGTAAILFGGHLAMSIRLRR
jgi:hypothetical protein